MTKLDLSDAERERRRVVSLLNLEKAREARKARHNAKIAKVAERLRAMVEGAGTLRDRMANPRRGLIKNKDIRGE